VFGGVPSFRRKISDSSVSANRWVNPAQDALQKTNHRNTHKKRYHKQYSFDDVSEHDDPSNHPNLRNTNTRLRLRPGSSFKIPIWTNFSRRL